MGLFFFLLRLFLPKRTFTSASRLRSESAFLCTLIIDSWRRQVLPFPSFCVYLFSSLSETRRATPRCHDDTAVINRYNRVRTLRNPQTGPVVLSWYGKQTHKPLNVFVLLQSRNSFLFNALLFLGPKPVLSWPCLD